MATLTTNEPRAFAQGDIEQYPVVGSDIIYEGAAVGENGAGYSRPLQAGDVFQGFALEQADNESGTAGAMRIAVRTRGKVELSVVGATAVTANSRLPVYASDDDTFTLTATGNSLIGYVSQWLSSGVCIVDFDAALVRAALQA